MFGINDLKERIKVTEFNVECPVNGCKTIIPRQRTTFRCEKIFWCPQHEIYISPSTFQYEEDTSNLLWTNTDDKELLDRIMRVKRESRMGRDNSEDALTWNTFRFLEKSNVIRDYIEHILGSYIASSQMIYWSYSQVSKGIFEPLVSARKEFELVPSKGSEPDLMILSKNSLVIIEAKLTATNTTIPRNVKVEGKYVSGGNGWWNQVIESDFYEVAVNSKKYELSRFWLLGTWMAEKLGVDFNLVILMPEQYDVDIEKGFGSHIKQNERRHFHRTTWEEIFFFISNKACNSLSDKNLVMQYLQNKSLGYDTNGRLRRAFVL